MGEPEQQLKMGKGQNEGGFSEEQLQMYKDCFKLMDINKDGQLDKNDLRGAFDNVGVLMSESELDGLLGEISGPCTYFSAKTLADPDKPANFEDSTFQTRYGQYGGGNHPNNIVAWYLTSTNISFIMNSQFTNKDILLWGMEFINARCSEKCKS